MLLISPGIFPYIYHVGSNFNISSILSNGLIPGGQELSRRQSVFFLPVDPRDENHRDPENIDYSVPRRARYVQNTWKRHQDTVFWIDIDLGIIKEGLKFYQTRSNAIILQGVLPSCIVRAERLKGGEPLYKRQHLSPRPPPKISLRHDLNWTGGNDDLGSTVEHRPVGKLVQQSLGETVHFGSSKPTQSPKTNGDRSGKPVAQEIVSVLQEEPSSSDRPGDLCRGKNNMSEITTAQGNLKERRHSTQCKKTIISKVVILWTSLTLQQTMRMLTSVSLAFLKKRWNVPKTLTFFNWFGESHVTHKNKPSRTISTKNNRSMHSALSRRRRSRKQVTLRFPRSSMRSRSGNASLASIIVIQELYTAYVDAWWQQIQPRTESTSHPPSTHSPYRASTSEKTDHVVTGMEKLQDAKNTIRHINLQRNAVKGDTKASTTGTSATGPSGGPWSTTAALNRWSSRWTSLRKRTTATKPARQKLSSTVAIGGYTQTWHALIQCR